ncbi:ATP-binding protein [Nitrospirillum viridazoti]|uniref:AAA domain-containing protein n=1 Tax=Nitrospirillum amazonense TaxID=28077 RepID=A0A560IYZ0_9PROT|nr:ATP-binding protein [Nitrospirillum amazonense]TWB64233.1 AAA domain-containing protein [Nitrospirillum amazonense]
MSKTHPRPGSAASTTSRADIAAQRQELGRRLSEVYLPTGRDRSLAQELGWLVDHVVMARAGGHSAGGIVAVVGDAGAGKTRAVSHALDRIPELQGNATLRVLAPSPCTPKELGRSILRGLGYELRQQRLTEPEIWHMVRCQLQAAGVSFAWVDEAHHAMGRCSEAHLMVLRDTLKSLVQQRDWPVGLVVSGLPIVSGLLGGDRQIERRSRTLSFDRMAFPAQAPVIREILERLVVGQARMRLHEEVATDDEFLHRLCHGAEGCLGSIVDMCRAAVLFAFQRNGPDTVVDRRDFAIAYQGERGCTDDQNIFLVRDWLEIEPSNSRLREAPLNPREKVAHGKRGRR